MLTNVILMMRSNPIQSVPISLCHTFLIQILILSPTPLKHIRNILNAVLKPCNYDTFTIPAPSTFSATVMDTPTLEVDTMGLH